jgi:hypothetical protein
MYDLCEADESCFDATTQRLHKEEVRKMTENEEKERIASGVRRIQSPQFEPNGGCFARAKVDLCKGAPARLRQSGFRELTSGLSDDSTKAVTSVMTGQSIVC